MPKMISKERKRGNRLYWILANTLTLPLSLYFAGLIGQILSGGLMYSPDSNANILTLKPLGILEFAKNDIKYYLLGFIISVLAINIFAFYIKLRGKRDGEDDDDRNFTYSDKDTYGTSRWMNNEEKNKCFDFYSSPKQFTSQILGVDKKSKELFTFKEGSKLNRHKCVIGGSGAGKTAGCVKNDIFQNIQDGISMVLTDPSGELFEEYASYLRGNGYEVKVFNLVNIAHSDSWNCLAEIQSSDAIDTNAQIFADTIIKNTGGDKNDDFWSKCALNLLKALCLYVIVNPIIPTNMGEVYKLLTTRNAVELDQLFDAMPMNEETQAAKMAYNVFRNASDNIKGGVLIDLGSRLQIFQSAIVRKITEYSEINFRSLPDKKAAFFVITSDQHSAFDFLAVLFYSMMFIRLVEMAHEYQGNTLPKHVNFILDEFANIGAIPDFVKKISTVRKYKMDITVIIQNIAQLQNRYPRGQWEEIIGNCHTQVFLGCDDGTTASYISEKTGTATILVESEKYKKTFANPLRENAIGESSGLGKRAIMNPDEVLQMPYEEEIVFIHGQRPYKALKYFYYNHPEYEKLTREKMYDYTPSWKAKEEADTFNNRKDIEKSGSSQEKYEQEKAKKPLRELAEKRSEEQKNKKNGKLPGFKF